MSIRPQHHPIVSLLVRAWEHGASHLLIDLSSTGRAPPRLRVDGSLHDLEPIGDTAPIWQATCDLFELQAQERRVPQTGRALLRMGDVDVGLAVEVVPVIDGLFIDVTLWLADPYRVRELGRLGLPPEQADVLRAAVARGASGLVIFCGPTSSGKNTSAYACLIEANPAKQAVATVETVARVRLPGVRQSVVDEAVGTTAAALLRSLRRTSIDVAYVRELMDFETAEVSVQLALSKGVTVLTTLHTTDAPSALTRLLNMGVEPYLVSATVRVIQGQRLLRRLCERCKQATLPLTEALRDAGVVDDAAGRCFGAVGCAACDQTGYVGRILVTEQLVLHDALTTLMINGASTAELRACAREHGMRTMREAALAALMAGETTLDEVLLKTVV